MIENYKLSHPNMGTLQMQASFPTDIHEKLFAVTDCKAYFETNHKKYNYHTNENRTDVPANFSHR